MLLLLLLQLAVVVGILLLVVLAASSVASKRDRGCVGEEKEHVAQRVVWGRAREGTGKQTLEKRPVVSAQGFKDGNTASRGNGGGSGRCRRRFAAQLGRSFRAARKEGDESLLLAAPV